MGTLFSFAESDYDIEDWIPVVEPFDEHPRLEARGSFHNYRNQIRGDTENITQEVLDYFSDEELDRLKNPGQHYHLELSYNVENTSGGIVAWCSPEIRQEGKMLEGDINFQTNIHGPPVAEARKQIVDEYRTPYLQTNKDLDVEENVRLAEIQIPENYDPATLKDTVQSIVNIYDETQRLENTLEETIREYEPQ
jgi:hypothetical protein